MGMNLYFKEGVQDTQSFLNHLFRKRRTRNLLFMAVSFFWFLFLFNSFTLVAKITSPKKEIKNPIAYDAQVMGTAITPSPTPTPTLAPTLAPTSTPMPTLRPRKTTYKIAVFGDSMVDTMGETLEYLDTSLKKKYPNLNFALYNYGQGSTNVEEGLGRFGQEFNYSTRLFEPVSQLQPDVIIVGSFAYNPFSPYDRDRHWLGLTKLVQEAEKTTADVYMLAEIAPLRSDFGKGPNGVNWDTQTSYVHSGHIIEQLENAVSLSKVLNVPLINAYQATLDKSKNFKQGKKEYVNSSDGIHPSVEGHKLMADLIVQIIKLK